MSDNVIEFPKAPEKDDFLMGPYTAWDVVVDGKLIPRLTGIRDGDKISLMVDRRFAASFSKADAYQAAWLIAHALAIGEGYPSMNAPNKDMPFAPTVMEIKSGDLS